MFPAMALRMACWPVVQRVLSRGEKGCVLVVFGVDEEDTFDVCNKVWKILPA
jgi:hypothetical protein